MKKLSKKVFLLPLCALIANPFSAVFAVKTVEGKSDHKHHSGKHHSSVGHEKKHTHKQKLPFFREERKIDGCCKIDEDKFLGTFAIMRYIDNMKQVITQFEIGMKNCLKSGQTIVYFNEAVEKTVESVFRYRHDLKEVFDARIAEYSELLHRVNLSKEDKNSLIMIVTKFYFDTFPSLMGNSKEYCIKRFVNDFMWKLAEDDTVRGIFLKYENGKDLLDLLVRLVYRDLNCYPELSLYVLSNCLKNSLI